MDKTNAGLFGITESNRDFTKEEFWGKNQFNSSFPIALLCYMSEKNIKPTFITVDKNYNVVHNEISVEELFKINPLGSNTYYSFETQFQKYQKYFTKTLPRNDVTIIDIEKDQAVSSFEIKLTALPDDSTCDLNESEYSSELVIRPDTIIYQACSIIDRVGISELKKIYFKKYDKIELWDEIDQVINYVGQMKKDFIKLSQLSYKKQEPLIIQPIWKTNGKKPELSENCLDVFIWSDLSFANLYMPVNPDNLTKINRQTRTLIWLTKMFVDYVQNGKFDGSYIIDLLTYNRKNDKAFSINGSGTYPFLKSKNLRKPRIEKKDIKHIILGGGQNLLSPERRFDAIIYNSPSLFKEE